MDIGIKMWRQEMAEAVEQRSLFRAPFSDVNRAGRALAYPRAARSRYNAAAPSTG
jgi:hypothetical protein